LVAILFDVGENHDLTLFRRELGQRFRQRFPQLPGHVVFDRVDGQRPLPAELLRSVVFGYLFLETSFSAS
jgi:hypothetical protein